MLWMDVDDAVEQAPLTPEEKARQLDAELTRAKKELAEVRKELAAKVCVQAHAILLACSLNAAVSQG